MPLSSPDWGQTCQGASAAPWGMQRLCPGASAVSGAPHKALAVGLCLKPGSSLAAPASSNPLVPAPTGSEAFLLFN